MRIRDLKPNCRNPRKITPIRLSALKKALEKFGDLSGFVYNTRTRRLISGHQRAKLSDGRIKITHRYEQPTACKTVASGYVEVSNERFGYREVDADETWESEALLAANKHGGEWDEGLVKIILADFPEINLELAGFDVPSITLTGSIPVPVVEDVEGVNPFDSVHENTEVPGRRIIIIIDCPNEDVKKELREKLRVDVEKVGAKFF